MPLSLILPTLNERENIERFVPELLREVPELGEILVVDDSSSDGTPEAVSRLTAMDPRVRLVERRGEPCLTEAIQTGIREARGDLVGWMDADLVMRPSDLRRLVAAVNEGADVAIGSRFVTGGRIKGQVADGTAGRFSAIRNLRSTEDPWLGVMLSWALNAVVLPWMVGLGIRDYTSGIVVVRRSELDAIELRGHHGEYFIHLWVELARRGKRIVEVPYRVQPRLYGVSKTGNDIRDYARRGRRYIAAGLDAGRLLRRGAPIPDAPATIAGGSGTDVPHRSASSRAKRTSR
jgi:dolichol-phosphate mannosyltransferase